MSQGDVWRGLARGLSLRCPECGRGPLLRRYLKVASPCAVCGHDNAQYPSDDAPPYFTILIIGHLVVVPMVIAPFIWTWPAWAVLSLTVPLVTAMTLALLPRVKGGVIGVQWAIRRQDGRVPGQDDHPDWTPDRPD